MNNFNKSFKIFAIENTLSYFNPDSFDDDLRLISGFRYTEDKFESIDVTNFFGLQVFTAVGDIEEVSGRLTFEYDLNPDTMIYFSQTRGIKPGGANLTYGYTKAEDTLTLTDGTPGFLQRQSVDPLVFPTFESETLDSTEIGLKADFFDGLATCVVGTHTHIPTADTRILEKGTAYQTDIGMCGDYNSVIGMNKENSIKRFFKEKDSVKHFPAEGEGTLSGIIVETNTETGLAKKVSRLIEGGSLT